MKTVLVCAAQAPFVTGGAEILVRELVSHLVRRGFRADVVAVPFHAHPPAELVRQALAWRLLELRETNGRSIDLVIPTKFPSYLVPAPRKVAWLFHQHREAYDLFGTPLGSFGDGPRTAAPARRFTPWTKRASASASACSRSRATSRTGWPGTTPSRARPFTRRRGTRNATAPTATGTISSTRGASSPSSGWTFCCARSRRAPAGPG